MKLSSWLKENRKTHRDFLALSRTHGADFSIHALAKWSAGERIPREKEMLIINKVTNGEVSPNDFCNLTH